jgi:L,D-peptidoglycan transpeptidase YkuD (ErfK/YbiS/YcfS/YnhG family)
MNFKLMQADAAASLECGGTGRRFGIRRRLQHRKAVSPNVPVLLSHLPYVRYTKAACAAALHRLRLPGLLLGIVLVCLLCSLVFAQRNTPPIRTMTQASTPAFRLLVKKAERKLYVYRVEQGQSKLFKSYTIALGPKTTGHKNQQGDGATPEGDYYLTHKNAKSKFYLSLGVSYPNIQDAAAGLKAGLISKAEHDAIVSAIRNQTKPPQNTRLGGDIFIHGGGIGNDWTLGCVALTNEDIKELFDLLPVKTPVQIVP